MFNSVWAQKHVKVNLKSNDPRQADDQSQMNEQKKVEGRLAIGEREVGEGLESSEKNFEEFDLKCGYTPAADTLLRETISQLETALCESTKLLAQRDNEINSLRNDLDSCRRNNDGNVSAALDEEVKNSQKRVLDLEKVIQQLQQDIAIYKAERESLLMNTDQLEDGCATGQTCYCGSLCGAMKEMVELKTKLQVTEQKYSNLKRAFKSLERSKVRVGVAHRDSPCNIS